MLRIVRIVMVIRRRVSAPLDRDRIVIDDYLSV
jgi:hypothetical protein